jgi:streptomycin 3"-adenylyltransferase
MAQYGWQDCPADVREQISKLTHHLATNLEDSLVGVYLHGSLALGCFNPLRSDVDLLVVSVDCIPLACKRQIVEHLLTLSGRPQPIEVSFLARAHLRPWRYPTPFDLHYSEMWRSACVRDLATRAWRSWDAKVRCDHDLAAHMTIIHRRGVCIAGQPIQAVFPAVPREDYLDSVARDLRDGLDSTAADPVYAILNCCRTLAYLREERLFSKEEGGRWACAELPRRYHGTVTAALQAYRSESTSSPSDPETLADFASFVRAEMHTVLGRPSGRQ